MWEKYHFRKVLCDYITKDINQQTVPLNKETSYIMKKVTITTKFFNKEEVQKYGMSSIL